MEPIILFRKALESEGEFDIAKKYMKVVEYRSQVPPGSLVIPRYSCLPFYAELEAELAQSGSVLINSHRQHRWIADVMEWAGPNGLLEGRTPRTWDNWANLPRNSAFVVKGRTNSKKNLWNTHMYASSRVWVPTVAARLLDDTFIGDQGLVVREYVPLKKLAEGINGQPITNEWRTFWHYSGVPGALPELLATGFYWGTHPEVKDKANLSEQGLMFAQSCAYMMAMADSARFFVLDVGELDDGFWILIEVNDGSMSGLGFVDPEVLYGNLAKALEVK